MYLKIILLTIFAFLTTLLKAQDASVEKSISGIQTGILGIWVHHESKISNEFVLRSEIGLDAALFGGTYYDRTGFLLTPVISFEPRWYYNFEKRSTEDKNTTNNSANFLTVHFAYNPDWFVISNYDANVAEQISIIPKWGFKRAIGNHLSYEIGIGLGYRYYFLKQDGYIRNKSETALDLHVRIGYTF